MIWDNEDKMYNDIISYLKKDVTYTNRLVNKTCTSSPCKQLPVEHKPKIKRVIFNFPATIIIWNDGTKTVVKCQGDDLYDREKGFVMCYLKKLLGNNNTFNKEINKWVWNDGK